MVPDSTRRPLENIMRPDARTIALGLAITALGLSPAAALAKHGADHGAARAGDDKGGLRDDRNRDDKRVTGTCTDGSTVKLKAKPDDGRLEVEFEVDQNVSGDVWKVKFKNGGDVVFKGRATTKGRSGSFSRMICRNASRPPCIISFASNGVWPTSNS